LILFKVFLVKHSATNHLTLIELTRIVPTMG
jgi:hypothetical protein